MKTINATQLIPAEKVPVDKKLDHRDFEELLEGYLQKLEKSREEVTGVGARVREDGSVVGNVVNTQVHNEKVTLEPLKVFVISDDAALRNKLLTHTPISRGYAVMMVGIEKRNVLVARPGRSLTLRGKMSTFGGGGDKGMTETEGLALIQPKHFQRFKDYFVAEAQEPKGRLLNPDKHYIACRWDRELTSYAWLREHPVLVRNSLTGISAAAQPMDWGPAAWTGRVADLSPGLAKVLGLDTDDECEVIIPLPTITETPKVHLDGTNIFHEKLTAIANRQHGLYSGCDESDEPLSEQIRKYWTESGLSFPAKGVEEPWSGAFISWCMKNAGATEQQFKFSGRHAAYIHPMIQNAKNSTGAFQAHPISKVPPRLGDLIHNYRGKTENFTYTDADEHGDYDSHTAIVVGFGAGANGRYALTIGGNEGDSVRRKEVPLNEDGTVKERKKDPFIAVVRTFLA